MCVCVCVCVCVYWGGLTRRGLHDKIAWLYVHDKSQIGNRVDGMCVRVCIGVCVCVCVCRVCICS